MPITTDEVKATRSRIACVNELLNSGVITQGALVLNVRNHLWEAFMWLGEQLGSMKEPTPYPASYDSKSAVIEKTANDFDQSIVNILYDEVKGLDDTGKVKRVRAMIKEIFGDPTFVEIPTNEIWIKESFKSLLMAKNWLGIILREIRLTMPQAVTEQWDNPPKEAAEPVSSGNPRPVDGGLGL